MVRLSSAKKTDLHSQKRKNKAAGLKATPNFPALDLLHDPQSFGEKLYDNLHRHGESLSAKFWLIWHRRRQALLARAQNSHNAAAFPSHGFSQAMCARLLLLPYQVRPFLCAGRLKLIYPDTSHTINSKSPSFSYLWRSRSTNSLLPMSLHRSCAKSPKSLCILE